MGQLCLQVGFELFVHVFTFICDMCYLYVVYPMLPVDRVFYFSKEATYDYSRLEVYCNFVKDITNIIVLFRTVFRIGLVRGWSLRLTPIRLAEYQ